MEYHDRERGGKKFNGIEEMEKLGSQGRHLEFVFDLNLAQPLPSLCHWLPSSACITTHNE